MFRKIRGWIDLIDRSIQVIRRYKNWTEILVKIYKKQRHTRLILRNGIQIDSPVSNPCLLAMVNDTFFGNVHTPTGLHVEANDVVVDIGANVGIFTLLSAFRTQKTVYAFEPAPENIRFLNRNIRTNSLHNVIVYDVAVCDKTGKPTRLYLGESVGHSVFTHNGKWEKYIEVPSMTLQHIMDNVVTGEVGFLKIDCEGCEGLIFLSTPTDYLRKIKKIVVEFHDATSPLKHDDIQRLLEEAGFETWFYWIYGKDSPWGYLYGKRE
jgi:FkbM family methyltransferase